MLIVLRSQSHLLIGVLRGDSPFELIQEIHCWRYTKTPTDIFNLKDEMFLFELPRHHIGAKIFKFKEISIFIMKEFLYK